MEFSHCIVRVLAALRSRTVASTGGGTCALYSGQCQIIDRAPREDRVLGVCGV